MSLAASTTVIARASAVDGRRPAPINATNDASTGRGDMSPSRSELSSVVSSTADSVVSQLALVRWRSFDVFKIKRCFVRKRNDLYQKRYMSAGSARGRSYRRILVTSGVRRQRFEHLA